MQVSCEVVLDELHTYIQVLLLLLLLLLIFFSNHIYIAQNFRQRPADVDDLEAEVAAILDMFLIVASSQEILEVI